jgi:hypothetical protein
MTYDPSEGLISGANLVGGLLRQSQQAGDYVNGLFDAHARRVAGDAMVTGDLDGAAGLLASRGMLDDAAALKAKSTTTKALTAENAGDYAGARSAAAAGGDASLMSSVSSNQEKDRAARAAWLAHGADALKQLKDPDQAAQTQKRQAAFKQYIAPTMRAMNPAITDAQLAQLANSPMTDEGLDSFKANLGQVSKMEIKQDPNSGELLGVDPMTGAVKVLHPGTRKPDWKEQKHADGSTTWVDLNSGQETAQDPTASATAPTGKVYDQIASAASAAGAKPEEIAYAKRLAQVESSGNPSAKNGSSTGLFQFHPDTFVRAGGGDINDVGDQTKAVLTTSRQDRAALQSAGVPVTDANAYIMHQQGPAGGKALLTAPPEVNAVAALTPIYGNVKTATKAIVNNGGTADMTAGEFVDMWHKRWSGNGAPKGLKSIPGSEAPSDDGNLSDAAVEQAAERYITSGALPPMGQGKTGTQNRDKILNKAAEMEKATGRTGAEAVAAWAGVKADTSTLATLTKNRGTVKTFEDTAERNGDLALSLAPKGAAPLNVPILNKWIQTGRKSVLGDPNVTQFDVAMGTFLDEYAKVTTGATGGTGTSDAARREAYDRISRYATQGQLSAGIATMKKEMANRIGAMDDEIEATQSRISGKAPAPHSTGVAPLSGTTAAQESARARFQNTGAKAGTAQNPFVPRTQKEYDSMAAGSYFINPRDGAVKQK